MTIVTNIIGGLLLIISFGMVALCCMAFNEKGKK